MTGRLKPFGDLGTVIPEKVQKLNLFDRISIYIYPSISFEQLCESLLELNFFDLPVF